MSPPEQRRPEIGPSITYHGKDDMAKLASKTEWVDTGDGIRRLVVEGAPIPPGIGLEDQASGDEVDPRTLTQPVVDEEASKPMHERIGAEAPEPNVGISTENAEASRTSSGGSRRTRRSSESSE